MHRNKRIRRTTKQRLLKSTVRHFICSLPEINLSAFQVNLGLSKWRRRPDLNRGWRFCRPLPYHLATAPIKVNHRHKKTRDGGLREILERETGFEPATSTLARSHSTTELFPPLPSLKRTTAIPNRSSTSITLRLSLQKRPF